MPISKRPRHRHNRIKTSQAPMHLPPHPVHAWRTFDPIYVLLDQLQTGSIDAKDGKPCEAQTFDDFQLEVTEPKLRPVGSKETGGPRDAPVRARDPARV